MTTADPQTSSQRLNTGVRYINYMGKLLLFFAKCATLRPICASAKIPVDNDMIDKNSKPDRHIPDLRREVFKETV